MPRLTPISWRDLVKRLHELGFEGPYAGGRHPQMLRGDVTVIISNAHEGDISVGLLSRLLKQAEVSREEWWKNKSNHRDKTGLWKPSLFRGGRKQDAADLSACKYSLI